VGFVDEGGLFADGAFGLAALGEEVAAFAVPGEGVAEDGDEECGGQLDGTDDEEWEPVIELGGAEDGGDREGGGGGDGEAGAGDGAEEGEGEGGEGAYEDEDEDFEALGPAVEPVVLEEVESLSGMDFDAGVEEFAAGEAGERAEELVASFVEERDDGAGADEDDAVTEEGILDFAGAEDAGVADVGEGERLAVVADPWGGFEEAGFVGEGGIEELPGGPGETGFMVAGVVGPMAADGEVIVDERGGEAPGGGGLEEWLVREVEADAGDGLVGGVAEGAEFGAEDDVSVGSEGVGEFEIGLGVGAGVTKDHIEHDGAGAGFGESADELSVEATVPEFGGILFFADIGLEVEVDDDDG